MAAYWHLYVESTDELNQHYSPNCQLSMSDLGIYSSGEQATKALKMQIACDIVLLEWEPKSTLFVKLVETLGFGSLLRYISSLG